MRERLELVDGEIARSLGDSSVLSETNDPGADSRVGALLGHAADGSSSGIIIRSILTAPLILDSRVIGALNLYRVKPRRWSANERHCAKAIASSLSQLIHQTQSNERAKSAADREALTNRLLGAIRTAVGVDDLLRFAIEGIGVTLGVSRAVIYLRSNRDSARPDEGRSMSSLKALAEYRESVLVPSLLGSGLDIQSTPILGQLLAGEIVAIPDTVEGHPVVRAIGVRLGVRAMALAPVAYRGQTVAVLVLEQFGRPREFSEEEIGLIRLVTEQTAVALYQAELYREAEESARREALISKISSAIHSSLDSDAVLQAIVNELGAALSVCRCRLSLLPNPMPEVIPITHQYIAPCCVNGPPMAQTIPVAGNLYLGALLSSDRPVATDNVSKDPRFSLTRRSLEAGRVKSVLATTIRLGGRPIGVFSLHHCEQSHSWTQWEIDVVGSVTEQAAVAIRQAELYREARESATRAALVNQMVASIRRSLDLEETLQVAVDELGRALGTNRTSLSKVDGDQIFVVAERLSGSELSVRDVTEGIDNYTMSYLLETRRTMVLDDVPAFAAAHPDLAATVPSWQLFPPNLSQIVSPIVVNGRLWGVLYIGQTDHLRKWSANDIALVEVVTAQVEVAVNHSRLFEEAKLAAQREALVSRIIHGINQTSHVDEIFPVVAPALGQYLAADRLVMLTFDDKAGLFTVAGEYNNGQILRGGAVYRTANFESLGALIQGDILMSSDVERDPRLAPYLEVFFQPIRARSFVAIHLNYERRPRLAIVAIMNSEPRMWTDDEADVMRAAADQVCIALQRAELFEQISQGKYEWEATFDALSDGIFIFDQHGILRRVNQVAAAFEGEAAPDLIGRRCCTLLQGMEGENCRVAQVMSTGKRVTFELVPERLSRPVLVTMSPLTDTQVRFFIQGDDISRRSGPLNVAPGAVCIVRDLSELRAAEAVAREQRSFLIKLIEHANDAIFALSPEGQFIWFNEQLVTLSGYAREEIIGSDYRRLIPYGEKKLAVEKFTRALAGRAQTTEIHGLRKTGEMRLLLVTYTPIYDEGRVTSVLSIARDITEERLASERAAQADKLRALGQLASGVAHNFNNVLAAVLGHAQLIKRDCNDERTLDRVEIIEQAALDGAQTVKRIQGFGQQQNESITDSVDVNRLVEDSTNLTRARWFDDAQARGLHFAVDVDLREVPEVPGSASDIREVFVNIILNALDAMPQGGTLKITTEAVGSTVKTHFSDTGIGMSRQVCERVFEPFFTTKGAAGTGLGLAVSYSIIERHGGRIEARSNPGQGSTFTITLPVGECTFEQLAPAELTPVKAARILVIDDDSRVREALAEMLSFAGHEVERIGSGPEGLALLETDRFNVVITDLSMPEMDGWAAAREIRRRWPSLKVVLITGFALTAETIKQNFGLVDKVIFKPIRLDDIILAVSQVLTEPPEQPLGVGSSTPHQPTIN
jgi:PAS domain S-box-containing protein